MEAFMTVLSMIGVIFLMGLVFAGAYFASKLVGKKMPGQKGATGQIEILDRVTLGRDKSLIIVRTAGQNFLIGVSAQQIVKIETLDSEWKPEPQAKPPKLEFKSVLSNVWKPKHTKSSLGEADKGDT